MSELEEFFKTLPYRPSSLVEVHLQYYIDEGIRPWPGSCQSCAEAVALRLSAELDEWRKHVSS